MTTEMSRLSDFLERKGSLFLRSDHMNYSRATLNSNWHQAREAEPKNYDINKAEQRDLCKATYDRIGDITDGSLPNTTYQDHAAQIFSRQDFTERETRKPMINASTFANAHLDRDTGAPARGFGAVLPRHHPDHNKHHLETTNRADFKPPFPYTPASEEATQTGTLEKEVESPDYTMAYKKCMSQFADTADYRRHGRNTWQDESGWYTNSHFKAQAPVYQSKNPITAAFQTEETS